MTISRDGWFPSLWAGQLYNDLHLNPFTVPACQISGLNRCTDAPANSIVSGPVNSGTLNAMCFDKTPFTSQFEAEDRRAERFQISLFYWSFSSDRGSKGVNYADIQLACLSHLTLGGLITLYTS